VNLCSRSSPLQPKLSSRRYASVSYAPLHYVTPFVRQFLNHWREHNQNLHK